MGAEVAFMDQLSIPDARSWSLLHAAKLDVIVDPIIYRLGHLFLEGRRAAGGRDEQYWSAIRNDLGGLAAFFDLVVIYDRLPAFNYTDTFDVGLNFHESLGRLVNRSASVIVPVDVKYSAYVETKHAAIEQLRKRLAGGPLISKRVVSRKTAADVLASLKEIEYEWEPNLADLEPALRRPGELRLARFIGGALVFAGYAQQTGAPHVLTPRRSRLVAGLGLGTLGASPEVEPAIYNEIARRFRDAGAGWRDAEMPWTPSFLPFLLRRMDRYRDGPDALMDLALELRQKPAIKDYRDVREAALDATDPQKATKARSGLAAAADAAAKALDSSRNELELTRHALVEILPNAMGVSVGLIVGSVAAGPPGALVGGVVGSAVQDALKAAQARLFGWVVEGLSFRSARKLLGRAVKADRELADQMANQLRTIWETGPKAAD